MGSIDSDSLTDVYAQTVVSERCQIAVACLLVYDAIVTLDREIKHFWSAPRQFVSIIYFSNRYIGISTAVFTIWFYSFSASKTLCILTYWSHLVADWTTILLIDYILLMRVAALYLESGKIVRWLRVIFVSEAIVELLSMILVNVYQEIGTFAIPGNISICKNKRSVSVKWGILSWLLPVIYGIILMILALYRSSQFWVVSSEASSISQLRLNSSQLIKVLIRDQIFYFLLVIICCASNILASCLGHTQFATVFLINVFGSPSLLCVLGSHLLFHLKEASERKEIISENGRETENGGGVRHDSGWIRPGETSDIMFAR